MKVLFVCGGNVGRSQAAEAYLRHFAPQHIATSAGVRYKGDQRISPTFQKLLTEQSVGTTGQKPKALVPEMVAEADRVVVLCSVNECPPFLLNSKKAEFWNIRDAQGLEIQERIRVLNEIREKVLRLIKELD